MKTPNYVLTQDYSFDVGYHDRKVIYAGTFVRPVELRYVPKHVLEDDRWRLFDSSNEVFCYHSLGFTPIPRNLLRET